MRDPKGLTTVRHLLSLALPDLDSVNDPTNAHAPKRAAFVGCLRDNSGDVYEPQDHRVWNLHGSARTSDELKATAGGRKVAETIAAQLVAHGWKGDTALDQDAATDLTKSFHGQPMHLGIQAFNDTVNVWIEAKSPRVCKSS